MRLSTTGSVATVHSDASSIDSNVNLRDLGRQPTKRRGMFGIAFNSMFQDEIENDAWRQEQRRPAVISCPTTGVCISKNGIAHEVVNNDEQWQEMKKQMKEKGAVNNMTLRQSLNGLLQDRVKAIPKDQASQASGERRKMGIADFATSLVLGDDSDALSVNSGARRTSSGARRHSPIPTTTMKRAVSAGSQPHRHQTVPSIPPQRRSLGSGSGEQAANIVKRAGRRLSSTASAALGSLNAERAESTSESLERRFSGNGTGSHDHPRNSGDSGLGSIASHYLSTSSAIGSADLRGIQEDRYGELGLDSVSDLGESTNRFDLVM